MKKLILSFLFTLLAANLYTGQQQPDRYKSFLFGVDYYPEQWPQSYWEQDAQRMQESGVTVVRIGEFGWSVMEPHEDIYDFSLFDSAIAVLAKHGIKVILGTPTATPPKWLTHKYTEVLRIGPDGRPDNDQTRRHYCYNSPVYRKLSKGIVEAMVVHYKDNPNVVGWQIDNEFNCETHECFSNSCRRVFRDWLVHKYKSLDGLNERWGTQFWSQRYTGWDQVDLPFPAPSFHNPGLMLDFKRFTSDSVVSYKDDQVEIIRKYRPNDFITHNGVFKNIDYYNFSRNLDIYSYDNYPTFSDSPQYGNGAAFTMTRGFNGRMMIMEEQTGPGGQTYLLRSPRPGEMNLWAFQAIAHGADGIIHFRWRTARTGAEEYWSGVLDQDNVPRARYQEFKKEGEEIKKIGPEILGSRIDSSIAVIKDYDDEWVFDHQYFTREVNIGAEYTNLFQAASELKYNIDIVSPNADFNRYKVVFGPHLILMDPVLAKKIRDFVAQGGIFIMGAHSSVKNRDNAMTDQVIPITLTDLFGLELDSFNCYQAPSRDKNGLKFEDGNTLPVNVFADLLKPTTAKVIATWDRDYMKGTAACTENKVGGGKAVYYGSFFNLESARYLVERFASEQKLRPLFPNFPKELEVTRRTKAGNNYYFILNHSNETVTVNVGIGFYDLIQGTVASTNLTLKPFEYKVLKRPSVLN